MSMRDSEVLEALRDEPELLAIADAVAETERPSALLSPVRWFAAVALAAVALFALVLAAPWDRGGGGGVLDRALAAVNEKGPVAHMTTRLSIPGAEALTAESYYDPNRRLLRVLTEDGGRVVSDFTTHAYEDEFTTFPGLLDAAAFYRTALENGGAKVVGKGEWQGRPVYWVALERGGGFQFRIGIDRRSYEPVVFRGLNPNGTPSGFSLDILGLDYVSSSVASFDTSAPVLVHGRVLGEGCRPERARVDAFLATGVDSKAAIASGRAGADGSFTLRVDPASLPIQGRGPFAFRLNVQGNDGFVFVPFSRALQGGGWSDVGLSAGADFGRPIVAPVRVELDPASC
jgi:hypothetical protein